MQAELKSIELILKKTKINSTILAQSLNCNLIDLKEQTILGWCVYKNQKYIIVYFKETYVIKKYELFTSLEEIEDITGAEYKFNFKVWYASERCHYYQRKSLELRNQSIEILKEAKFKATEKGQFYI
jgi:hypothetical protein